MNTFNFQRFTRMLVWDIATNRQRIIKQTITYAIILLTFALFITQTFSLVDYQNEAARVAQLEQVVSLSGFFFFIVVSAAPSLIFDGVNRNKQTRLSFLMMPASNIEKYVSRIITTFIVYVLTYIVAFFIADLAQWLISFILHPSQKMFMSGLMFDFNLLSINYNGSETTTFLDWYGMMAFNLWIISLYMLGGTLFRRYAWLFVSVIVFLGVIFVISLMKEMGVLYNWDWHFTREQILATVSGLCTVFAILNIFLSFRLFKRLQLINNKWINL